MSQRTSNEQTLVERLRDCVKVTFSAGLHGVESDCREAADELDRQRAEIERLTRERDEARSASVPGSAAVFAAVEAERDRMRAALEKIADFDCRSDEHVGDMKCWSCYARDALSAEPSSDETKPEPDVGALNRQLCEAEGHVFSRFAMHHCLRCEAAVTPGGYLAYTSQKAGEKP